jgi:hypothetical protein
MLLVIPWLLVLPILYSAFRDGESAAPMVIPSNMALLFSKPSGNGGNSFVSIGVWLTIIGVLSEGSRLQYLLSQTVGYKSKKIILKHHNNSKCITEQNCQNKFE